MKMYAYIFFFNVFIASLHFDRFGDCIMYPHVLPTCNYFPGGRPILQVAFYLPPFQNVRRG